MTFGIGKETRVENKKGEQKFDLRKKRVTKDHQINKVNTICKTS